MPSRCDSTQQATWSKQLKRAEEDGRLRCRTVLPVGVTARELVNVSRRITMNEGMVGALRCDDTAAGSLASRPTPHIVLRGWSGAYYGVHTPNRQHGVFVGTGSAWRPLAVEHLDAYSQTQAGVDYHCSECYHWPCTLLEGENGQPHTAESVIV